MGEHYDLLETRPPAQREASLLALLPAQVAQARRTAAYAELLRGIDPEQVRDRASLAALPVTRKSDLMERQQAGREGGGDPLGGFARHRWGASMPHVFASPGPIYEPDGCAKDHWRLARAMFAAGIRAGDLVHNCFSYHFVPAGLMMETGAHALGCTVFPGGTGQTEQQVRAMADLRPDAYVGTPSFLRIIVEKASEMALALPSLRKAMVGAEAFPPALRDWLQQRGVVAYQCLATADLGLIAYETEAREGLVLDEGVIVEIVRPGSGEPVTAGEVGELVVTSLNPDYPLLRFGTGDLTAILPGPCPSGRTNTRIKGWLGRADQTTKVRGMFVHPAQVHAIVKRFPQAGRARLVVKGELARDSMTLLVETAAGSPVELAANIALAMREVTKLRGEVELVPPGSLPDDGKVIEDLRSYG